eukprot:jgi/Mesen1/7563/ME000392S06824
MSGKAVAEKITKAIDWEALAKVIISDEGKREMSALRRTFDDVSNTLETKMNQKPASINWSHYREKLNPKVVDIFKKSYESLKIPEYVDNYTPSFQKEHADLVAKAAEAEEFSKKELGRLKQELAKVQSQKEALATETVDDYFKKNPEVKAKIDKEIENQNWGY